MFQAKGITVIQKVLASFNKQIVKLEEGIALCNKNKDENVNSINTLNEENCELATAVKEASTVVENLNTLLGRKV